MKTEKRIVQKEVEIYIADDGKEFSDQLSCEEYEEELMVKKQEAIAERLSFDTKGIDWPSMAKPYGSEHEYKWFRLENDADLLDFCRAYSAYNRKLKDISFVKMFVHYPDYICLVDYPHGPEDPQWFTLSKLLNQLFAFLNNIPVNENCELI